MAALGNALAAPFSHKVERGNITPLSWTEWVIHCRNKRYHQNNIGNIAQLAQEKLNQNEISHALLKQFLKTAAPYGAPGLEGCKKALLAAKLGIPFLALNDSINPGFSAFAEKVYLEAPLRVFNHKIKVSDRGDVALLHSGVYKPWSELKEIAFKPIAKHPLPFIYNPPCKYGLQGVESRSYYQWSELLPFKIEENPSWGNRHLLEICFLCSGKFRLMGDHTWVRLKTPDGKIYSFGLYREDNRVSRGFEWKSGDIQQPDVSEFWPEKIHTIPLEISEADFLKIKAKVENDHKNLLPFHVIRENCTVYAVNLAKEVGINISSGKSFTYNVLPLPLQKGAAKVVDSFPFPIRKVAECAWECIHYLSSVFFNLAHLALGGWRVSPTLPKNSVKPHIASFRGVFHRHIFPSPRSLFAEVGPYLEKRRREEAERRGIDPKNLSYWVPPEYRREVQ